VSSPSGVDERFLSAYKLCKTDEFSSVFAFRKSLRSAHFQLLYRPNGGVSARLGAVMAKKLAKRAVGRNLLKRLGRESFRALRGKLPHYDFVLRLAVAPGQATKGQLRAELDGLFKRLMQ
jgi:ribonuclease P protein component